MAESKAAEGPGVPGLRGRVENRKAAGGVWAVEARQTGCRDRSMEGGPARGQETEEAALVVRVNHQD